jgi:hypothetical protein
LQPPSAKAAKVTMKMVDFIMPTHQVREADRQRPLLGCHSRSSNGSNIGES